MKLPCPGRRAPALVLLVLAPSVAAAQAEAKPGHSLYGPALDEGPRTRPARLSGIGRSHFPITTRVPEVQEWFDQGHTLLHSYEYWEAERAFRWCVKLDPGCATAWWGLARAVGPRSERFEALIREAVRRKESVSEHERRYIDAWARAYEPDLAGAWELRDPKRDRTAALVDELEEIALLHPDDIEAKALLVNHGMGESRRLANEALLREIERVAPEHPGLHHYRIHVWDGEDGVQALASCRVYGKIAGALGHPNHMPGHVFSSMGLWHEAAIWMESATRTELAAMNARQVFPFQYWNFPHNRNYLAYIQEQLGRPEDALAGARVLLATPRDPQENDPTENGRGPYHQGKEALLRCLAKFERWDELLAAEGIAWRDTPEEKGQRAYLAARAHVGKGELLEAAEKVAELGKLLDEAKEGREGFERAYREARAFLQLARGEDLAGLAELSRLAEEQALEFEDDPPGDPEVLYTALGEAYLARGAPRLAAQAFERALEVVRNDGFALSGLARARHGLGELDAAREAAGKLLHVWSGADPELRWLADVQALGLDARPIEAAAGAQRVYGEVDLSALGPLEWQPYPAPELDALDPEGATVTLAEHRDQNVLLVFYLGAQCPHCVEQLAKLGESAPAFAERDTVLLAISSDSPETNRAALERGPHAFRLLSDRQHESARRFQAWDDFEELELHATVLIDRLGRVRWARVGGEPFMEVEFLLGELDRWKDAAR
ncbi:MAG TPA: redoxin domain-containing protein [Planctomycetota bacterium]